MVVEPGVSVPHVIWFRAVVQAWSVYIPIDACGVAVGIGVCVGLGVTVGLGTGIGVGVVNSVGSGVGFSGV